MIKRIMLIIILMTTSLFLPAQIARTIGGLILKSFAEGFFSAAGEDTYNRAFNNKRVEDLYAQYPELRNELDDIKDDINEHDTRISTLESDMKDVNSKLQLLDTRVEKLERSLPYGSFSIGTGIGKFQGTKYTQFHTLANLHIGEGSIGLFLNAHNIGIDDNTLKRDRVKLINIVPYIKFGSEEDKAYLNMGAVNTSNYGYGFMFRNYTNDLLYSNRQFGMKAGINSKFVGVDMFNSNISQPGIFAGRVNVKPLSFINAISYFNRFNIGFSYITDTRKEADEIKINAIDAALPIYAADLESFNTVFSVYGNYASISKYGSGYGYGVNLNSGNDGFNLNLFYESRKCNPYFQTGLFDPFYESDLFTMGKAKILSLNNIQSKTLETVIGGELSASYFTLSGHYVINKNEQNIQNKSLNYYRVQSSLNYPVLIKSGDDGDLYARIGISASIDIRDKEINSATDFGSLISSEQNKIFNFTGSINFPIEERVNLYLRHIMRDFFDEKSSSIEKINYSFTQFGLQYNFGLSVE